MKIMIAAGEVSGDMHGANLARALRHKIPSVELIGLGGERMRAEGVEIKEDLTPYASIGFLEGYLQAIAHLPSLFRLLRLLKQMMREERPEVVVLVDNPGVNMKIASLAKDSGIPTVYYVPPQVWAWGGWQAKDIAELSTKIIPIFPFEVDMYKKFEGDADFLGHPLVGKVSPTLSPEEAYEHYGLDPERPVIILMPGSRRQEIARLLPLLISTAEIIDRALKSAQFILPVSSSLFKPNIEEKVKKGKVDIKLCDYNTYDLMNIADLLLVTSGTATLEAALIGTPMIVFYKLSVLTWLMGRMIVKLPYISLPNIIAGREIIPELLQWEAKPKRLAEVALDILGDEKRISSMKDELRGVVEKLGEPGAVERAADIVIKVGNLK